MDYDTWKTTPYWDTDELSLEERGYVHEDDLPDLPHAEMMLDGLIKAIYVSGDICELEYCLEELASCFKKNIPCTLPVLRKKRDEADDLFETFADVTRSHAYTINKENTHYVCR